MGLVAGLSGCWLQVGYGPEHRRHNDLESSLTKANVGSLAEAWAVSLNTGDEPMVSGGRVFVSHNQSAVRALDARTGATVWERSFGSPGFNAMSQPALSGGQLWVSSSSTVGTPQPICLANQLRLDPATGETVADEQTTSASAPVTAGPVVADVRRSVTSSCARSSLTLRVRDSASLATLWTFAFPAEAVTSGEVSPTIADGRVFVVVGDTLYAFDQACAAPCSPLWTLAVAPAARTVGVSPVAGEDGQVFVRTFDGETLSVDGATGSILWRSAAAGRMALAGDTLYIGAAGELQAFRASGCTGDTCSPMWTAALPSVTTVADVAVAGGVAYVSGDDDVIHALDAAGCGAPACDAIAALPTGRGTAARLVVSDGTLFATTRSNAQTPSAVVAYRPAAD